MKWKDPRLVQIVLLGSLLAAGATLRDFSLRPLQVVFTFASVLLTQALFLRILGIRNVNYLSAVITGLGLSLLLRADSLWVHPVAAFLAISAKFLIRVRGKHVFNPANLGVMLALILLPGAWVSPGQWGQDVAVAGWFLVLGNLVVMRARRVDVSWAFLIAFLGLAGARVLWLGLNPAGFVHLLSNGSILLFAFFMISDPMTIPDSRRGRLLHAALVAGFAFFWQFGLFRTNGLLWSLLMLSPLVPVWDRLWPARRYVWIPEGGTHEPPNPAGARPAPDAAHRSRPARVSA